MQAENLVKKPHMLTRKFFKFKRERESVEHSIFDTVLYTLPFPFLSLSLSLSLAFYMYR